MGRYKISEHRDEIITHIIKNVIYIPIANLFTAIISVIESIRTDSVNTWTFIISIVSLFISVILVVLFLKLRFASESKDKKEVCPLTNFRISNVETELCFNDRESIISTLNYDMIATEDNVECFEKEIIWTGKDYYGTQITKHSGDCRLELTDNNDSLHQYKVIFSEPLNREEQVKFSLETSVKDSEHTMHPVSTYMVKHQIDKLIIRVVAPQKIIKNVRYSIYVDLARQIQVGTSQMVQKRTIGKRDFYEIEIHNPTILYRYGLEWEFTK